MKMETNSNKCYFCDELSQYNYTMQTSICSYHWSMMYYQDVPNYIPNNQILNYRKIALIKKLKKNYDN